MWHHVVLGTETQDHHCNTTVLTTVTPHVVVGTEKEDPYVVNTAVTPLWHHRNTILILI
jgi:hypothetical protein